MWCGLGVNTVGWFKKIKSVPIYSASNIYVVLYYTRIIGKKISQKWVLRVSQGGSIIEKVDFQDVPNYLMWVL